MWLIPIVLALLALGSLALWEPARNALMSLTGVARPGSETKQIAADDFRNARSEHAHRGSDLGSDHHSHSHQDPISHADRNAYCDADIYDHINAGTPRCCAGNLSGTK